MSDVVTTEELPIKQTVVEKIQTPKDKTPLREDEVNCLVKLAYPVFPFDPEKMNRSEQPELFKEKLNEFTRNKDLLEKAINTDPKNIHTTLNVLNNFLAYYKNDPTKLPQLDSTDPIDVKINNFLAFEEKILMENSRELEELIKEGSNEAMTVFKTLINLARVSSKNEIKENVSKILLDNFEKVILSKNTHWENDLACKEFTQAAPVLATIFEFGNDFQKETINSVIVKLFKDNDINVRKIMSHQLADYDINDENVNIEPIEQALSSAFGINAIEALEAWRETDIEEKIYRFGDEGLIGNLLALSTIELERPKIGKTLQSEFGINDFARYPKEMLIDQYDKKDLVDNKPYGIIIYPRADRNGAFTKNVEMLRGMYDQIKGGYGTKIYEIETELDLVKVISRIHHRFGKISFAIIDGHGNPDSVRFGFQKSEDDIKKVKLSESDIGRKAASSAKQAFVDNPVIIFNSCSTGVPEGIGQEISKILHALVIAPPGPTFIKKIDVKIIEGKINFEVTYKNEDGEDVIANIYLDGIQMNSLDKT